MPNSPDDPKVEILPKDTVISTPSESGQEIKAHAEAVKKMELVDDLTKDIVVVASTPDQMRVAQASLVGHFTAKVERLKGELEEAKMNMANAKTKKWKVLPFERMVTKVQKEMEFYEKVEAALKAGYVIIPNFPDLDIFAIRTTRRKPKANLASNPYGPARRPIEQKTNMPMLGEGRYVNADTINHTWTTDQGKNAAGDPIKEVNHAVAKKFDDVDFPFHFAKPQVVEGTAKAMDLLIFDDIGISPSRHIRRGDPVVIGRLHKKVGNYTKTTSFLISWFVNTADI